METEKGNEVKTVGDGNLLSHTFSDKVPLIYVVRISNGIDHAETPVNQSFTVGIRNPQLFGIRNPLWYGIRNPEG